MSLELLIRRLAGNLAPSGPHRTCTGIAGRKWSVKTRLRRRRGGGWLLLPDRPLWRWSADMQDEFDLLHASLTRDVTARGLVVDMNSAVFYMLTSVSVITLI